MSQQKPDGTPSDSSSKSISFLLNRLIVISTVTFVTSEMVVNDVNVLN